MHHSPPVHGFNFNLCCNSKPIRFRYSHGVQETCCCCSHTTDELVCIRCQIANRNKQQSRHDSGNPIPGGQSVPIAPDYLADSQRLLAEATNHKRCHLLPPFVCSRLSSISDVTAMLHVVGYMSSCLYLYIGVDKTNQKLRQLDNMAPPVISTNLS